MKECWNDQWQEIFSANKLDSFDAIWNLDTEWFEEPNQRRGGWSGVIKVDLDTPEGKSCVFIKRQENHISKTLLHPIRGILTFEREFENILQKFNLLGRDKLAIYEIDKLLGGMATTPTSDTQN